MGEKSKKNLAVRLGIAAGCVILAVAAGYYGWKAYHYKDIFFHGTVINGIACEELTAEQVEELIREQVEDYGISLEFRNGEINEIDGSEIDYQYVSSGEVKELLQKQKPMLWIGGYFGEHSVTIDENITFDEEKLYDKLEDMPCMQEEAQVDPEDAYVKFKTDQFIIVDEVYGSRLKKDELKEAVVQAVETRKTNFSAEEAGVYVMPEYTKDSEKIKKEQEQLNELARVSVTYKLPNGKKVFNGNKLRKWLDVDEEDNYTLDQEKLKSKVADYVRSIAEEVDTLGKARPFHTTSGHDVTVKGGKYGWKVNQEKEVAALLENIKNHDIVKRKPKYSSKELYTENNGLGNTYIEVNLTEQYLYYYVDGQIEVETPIVSGTMTSERFTPPGVYFLTYKQMDRILRGRIGEDGQPSYEAHVDYWMPFNGGIGLHDASWRGSFGGKTYVYSGSHGCINLPHSAAKRIYSLIDKETPIVCVYNNGYSLHG